MRQPSIEELVAQTGGRYAAVAIVAARARQLAAGDVPAVDTDALNPVTIAMEELARGRLRIELRESPHVRAATSTAGEEEPAVVAVSGGSPEGPPATVPA